MTTQNFLLADEALKPMSAQELEAQRIAADMHYNELKRSGELDRRREERRYQTDRFQEARWARRS